MDSCYMQVVTWVLITIVQTLPLWENLAFFRLEGIDSCRGLLHVKLCLKLCQHHKHGGCRYRQRQALAGGSGSNRGRHLDICAVLGR